MEIEESKGDMNRISIKHETKQQKMNAKTK